MSPEPSRESVVDTRDAGGESCAALANRAFEALHPGDHFLLVADHDPQPLHYMLQAERPGQVGWEAVEQGPDRWQARITRVGS